MNMHKNLYTSNSNNKDWKRLRRHVLAVILKLAITILSNNTIKFILNY